MIGEEIKGDGYRYKCVTIFDDNTYFCFLKLENTVSDLITSFLKLTLGNTYLSSKDYNSYIVFRGVEICQYTVVMNSFKPKKRQ